MSRKLLHLMLRLRLRHTAAGTGLAQRGGSDLRQRREGGGGLHQMEQAVVGGAAGIGVAVAAILGGRGRIGHDGCSLGWEWENRAVRERRGPFLVLIDGVECVHVLGIIPYASASEMCCFSIVCIYSEYFIDCQIHKQGNA